MAVTKKVYVITGARGSGKSMAIATFPRATKDDMGKMLVVDTEDSMSDILEHNKRLGLEFGEYIRMYDRFRVDSDMLERIAQGKLPWVGAKQKRAMLQYWDFFVEALDKRMKDGQFKYVGIDTIEPIEAALTAWAESNPRESGWSGTRAYGRLETEGVRPLYENLLEALFSRGAEYIILTSHLKKAWEDDRPVLNKVQPGGRLALLSRISSTMLWLVKEAKGEGAPAAIVLKARACIMSVEGENWVPKRALPDRIPEFSWKKVREYLEHGYDIANPAPGETMSHEERIMISELLSDAQMRLMVASVEKEIEEAKAVRQVEVIKPVVIEVDEDKAEIVRELMQDKELTPMEIADKTGMMLPDVIRVINT